MRFYISIAMLLFVIGCNPPVVTTAFPGEMWQSEPRATLVVLRARVAYGALGGVMIQIDGRHIANIGREDRIEIDLPPGVHALSVPGASQSLSLLEGNTYYVVVTPGNALMLSSPKLEDIALRLSETKLYATNRKSIQ